MARRRTSIAAAPAARVVTELWETRSSPADNRGRAEVTDHPFRLAPPSNGSVFRIIEYPPDRQRLAALAQERAAGDDGSGHIAALDRGSPRHPGFHKTSSVNYAIVLAGEIYALMDDGRGRCSRPATFSFSAAPTMPGATHRRAAAPASALHRTDRRYAIVMAGEIHALDMRGSPQGGRRLVKQGTNTPGSIAAAKPAASHSS